MSRFARNPSPASRQVRPELSRSSWRKVREQVKRRDGYRCVVCGSGAKLVADHIIPAEVYLGHHDNPANLQTLCDSCNRSKGRLPDAEWKAAVFAMGGRPTAARKRRSYG